MEVVTDQDLELGIGAGVDAADELMLASFRMSALPFERALPINVSEDDRINIRRKTTLLKGRKGAVMFEEGKTNRSILCIKSGLVKLSVATLNGETVTLQLLTEGHVLGHLCLINDKALYTATCLTACEFYRMPCNTFQELSEASLTLGMAINKIVFEEIKTLSNRIISLHSKSIVERLAETLIAIQTLRGKDSLGYIDIFITKQELSNMVGASIESVFRALASLKEQGYVEQHDKRFRIVNDLMMSKLASSTL